MQTNKIKNQKSHFRFTIFLLIVSLSMFLTSCYPDDTLTVEETDVIATFYKAGTDFSTKQTFAMPDSVFHIQGDEDGSYEAGIFDQQIINRIKLNLIQIGYTEVSDPGTADVLVTPAVTTTTWVSGGCYSWYYYWYPYPGYCYPVAYTYTTGSILISMGEPNTQENTEVLWFAGINGILEDSSTGIEGRIDNNIDQAFNQSEYLSDGK